MKKFLSFLLFALCVTTAANAQPQTLTIGEPVSHQSPIIPIFGDYLDGEGTLSQFIVPAELLTDMDGGTISKMIFYTLASYYLEAFGSYSPEDYPEEWFNGSNAVFSVALSEVSETEFASGDDPGGYDHSSLTEVYHGTFPESIYQLEIEFDNPYPYHGGNLLVSINVEEAGTYGTCYWIGVSDEVTYLCYYQYNGYSGLSFQTGTFMPKTTFTYVPATTEPCVITAVNVTGYESPVAGENSQDHLNITVLTVPEDANYSFYMSPLWYDDDANYSFYGIFDEGTHYSVGMVLEANSGCVFDDNCTFYVNGNTTLVDLDYSVVYSTGVNAEVWTKSVAATGSTTEPCVISEINIEGFTAPEWGANPDYDVEVPADADYTLDYVDWNWDDGDNMGILNESGTFNNEDYVYYMYFLVLPNEGCSFADDVTFMVNGETGSIENSGLSSSGNGYWAYSIDYTVTDPTTEPCVISEINIEGFTAPEWGANPDYEVNVPADADYTLDNVTWMENYSHEMSTTETFEAKMYYMVFDIVPNEGCTFADEVTVTINGDASLVDPDYGGILSYKYRVFTIDYYLSAPPTCEAPTNLTATNITHNDATLGWTDNNNADVWYVDIDVYGDGEWADYASGDVYSNSFSFHDYFDLTPGETYRYRVQSICSDENRSDFSEFYLFTTTEEPTCVINTIEITGFTEPVYGATPDYDVEVPADANYTLGNVYWSENSIVMNTPVPFGANEYFMNIYIIPNEGCTFSDEVSVTINGNTEPVDPFSEVISDGSYHIYTIDYTLSAPSTCETPTNLSVSDITSNSATLSWTGNVEEYEIEYGRGGYYYYGFESGDLQDWTNLIVNTGEGEWLHSDDNPGSYDYTSLAHNGTGFAMCYSFIDYDGAYNTDAYLVSPQKYQINNGASLSFWYDMANEVYPEYFEVSVATVDNPTTDDFTSIWNLQDDGSKYNAWRDATIDLSAYAGQAIWIAFHDVNYDEYEIWIDDITVKTEAWTTVENATSPHTLNSLEAETPYFVHVRAICEDGVSAWTEPVEFTTTEEPACVITEVYVNGYESPVAGENSQDHLNITLPDNANYYLVESAYSPTWYDEDADDYFNGSFVGGTRYSVGVEIHANDGCVFANNCTFLFDGDENLVNPEYTGVDYEDNTIAYIWTMPELATGTTSPCETPTGLTASNITATTAKLEWTGSQDQYTVRYKEDAASDWTEATTTNRFFPLTGLTPETTYTAQVQGDCGSGAKSVTDWSEPVTFTTLSGTIEPGECGPAVDCEGTSYPTVKIGDVCWMAKNLAAETCVTTGNVYAYVNDQFPDEDANVETYGLLYDEEAAFATGLCPEGYTLPTTEQFEYLKNNFTVEELRNSTGWVVNTGTNGTGFSWDGSGFYNGTSDNFEHMLMEGYLWAVDMTSGTPQPAMYKMMYYCNEIVRVYDFDGISASIRCVKNAEPQPEPQPEPETFRCGIDELIISESQNHYQTVQIGTQCWTKTNLRETKDKNGNTFRMGIPTVVVTELGPSLSYDYDSDESMVYIPDEENWYYFSGADYDYDATVIGYYYNWEAAQVACPDGWHLPSQEEWNTLVNYVSSQESYVCGENNSISKALSSEVAKYWPSNSIECAPGNNPSANNATGFSGVPAGFIQSEFSFVTMLTAFWSTTNYNNDKSWAFSFGNGLNLNSGPVYKYIGNSVRCLRDAEE